MKKWLIAAIAAAVLGTGLAQAQTIHIGYVLWDSCVASNNVVAALIEDRLGYEVDLTSVDAGPMFAGLARGDFDAVLCTWLPATHEAYWDKYGEDLTDLGVSLDGADIGWAVPSYVDVDSIDDLNDHASEFDGEIIGIDPGAGLMAASDRALEAYGLTNFTLLDGSDAAMAAALDRAITRNEPIIVTSWRPHWMWAAYDLKYLEDPLGVFGASEQIHTVANDDFAANGPADVLELLRNFHWTGADMGAVMLSVRDGMDPADAARAWIADNTELVDSWFE
ncbi:MAG TPA: glycine betaine ABC transporter substrate-binding protein [Trueperaceae bacterium]|nr:glycine betaine ABC transporter substrate-binding protein [Trueperaceae bacterium]